MTAAQHDEQYIAAAMKQARDILKGILGKLVSADDPQFGVLQAICDASVPAGVTFREAASNLGHDITPDLVAVYLTWIIDKWERGGAAYHRTAGPKNGPAGVTGVMLEIVNEIAAAELSRSGAELYTAEFRGHLHELAGWAEADGNAPMAYNAMVLALGCGTRHDADQEALARGALRLAEDADKPHQIAVCAAAVASAIAWAAAGMPERRLEAFDACEYAIQRIARTSKAQLAAAAELRPIEGDLPRREPRRLSRRPDQADAKPSLEGSAR